MYSNDSFNRTKTKRYSKAIKRKIYDFYTKKRLLCDKCPFRGMSIEQIQDNYEKITKILKN